MTCIFCNEKTNCVDSREENNIRRRRYACPNCGNRFSTEEVVISEEQTEKENTLDKDQLMAERRKSFEFGLSVGRRMGKASFSDGGSNG